MTAIRQPLEGLALEELALKELPSIEERRDSRVIQFLRGRSVFAGTFLVLGPVLLYFPFRELANHVASESSVEGLDHLYRVLVIASESWGLVKLLFSRV